MLKHHRLVGPALEQSRQASSGKLTLFDLMTYLVQTAVIKHALQEAAKFIYLLRKAMNIINITATSANQSNERR